MDLRISLDLKSASIHSDHTMRIRSVFGKFLKPSVWLTLMWPMAALAFEGLELRPSSKGLDEFGVFDFTCKFSVEKDPIRGTLIKPSGEGPFPAVVCNHGRGGSGDDFCRTLGSIFVKSGYVAIGCDLTHQGEAKSTELGPSKENAERIIACATILEAQPFVNKKQICVYGHSMGGFATIAVCTQTDKFKAAAITAGGIGHFNRPDYLDTEEYVAKITTPFFIIHGKLDKTVKLESATKFKTLLDKYGKTSEMKIYEDAEHPLWRDKRDDVYPLIIQFFKKYLKE